MIDKVKDKQYVLLVDYILNDKDFNKIADSKHHGTSRLDHSIKVSYYSYKIARKLGLDFEATAKAGLLHDYFTSDNEDIAGNVRSLFKHPKTAANNAINQFGISEKEQNIIETHMFPLNIKPSKYTEGWIVSLVDKSVSIFELSKKFKYAITLWGLFLLNVLK